MHPATLESPSHRRAGLRLAWAGLLAGVGAPAPAFAEWGTGSWGQMVWGAGAIAVPALGPIGLTVLAGAVALGGAWVARRAGRGRPGGD